MLTSSVFTFSTATTGGGVWAGFGLSMMTAATMAAAIIMAPTIMRMRVRNGICENLVAQPVAAVFMFLEMTGCSFFIFISVAIK